MSESSPTTETIERELAALGEAPASAEELALADAADQVDQVGEVAHVARLAELAEPLAFDDLSELETHRSWRNVEQRLAQPSNTPASKQPTGGGPRRWLLAAVGLAAAAAILLVVLRPLEHTQPDAELVAELGEQARVALKALDDGTSDTQRAEQLAADYQRQLEEQDG